jgi:hypothetical protein
MSQARHIQSYPALFHYGIILEACPPPYFDYILFSDQKVLSLPVKTQNVTILNNWNTTGISNIIGISLPFEFKISAIRARA